MPFETNNFENVLKCYYCVSATAHFKTKALFIASGRP